MEQEQERDWQAVWGKARHIASTVTEAEARMLYALARATRGDPSLVVELGTWMGRSAVVLAMGAQRLIAIDRWAPYTDWNKQRLAPGISQCRGNLERAGVAHLVRLVQSDTSEAASMYEQDVGLLFIDGDHTHAGVRRDWEAWRDKLIPGAVVAWHDYTLDNPNVGVRELVDELLERGDLRKVRQMDSLMVTML